MPSRDVENLLGIFVFNIMFAKNFFHKIFVR